ncbi:MAG TPA: hypothetical protein DEP72_07215 [Clostridiales bacterium]|nr:MAG: hypothetical protein A2Y18_07160 [Clostridiales bacterium GWD2_32_19]HCC07924.1 hypothetical protein [Clostridiales bacterium]
MQKRKDLVFEAQIIIDDYVRKKQLEKLTASYEFMKKYSQMKTIEKKRKQRNTILNFVLILSVIFFVNILIYLIFSLNFLR